MRKTFTSKQVAEKLGISYGSLRNRISRGAVVAPGKVKGRLAWNLDYIKAAKLAVAGIR